MPCLPLRLRSANLPLCLTLQQSITAACDCHPLTAAPVRAPQGAQQLDLWANDSPGTSCMTASPKLCHGVADQVILGSPLVCCRCPLVQKLGHTGSAVCAARQRAARQGKADLKGSPLPRSLHVIRCIAGGLPMPRGARRHVGAGPVLQGPPGGRRPTLGRGLVLQGGSCLVIMSLAGAALQPAREVEVTGCLWQVSSLHCTGEGLRNIWGLGQETRPEQRSTISPRAA